MHRTLNSRFLFHRPILGLPSLPLQLLLRLRYRNRHKRPGLPTRTPTSPDRSLHSRDMHDRSLRHQRRNWSSHHNGHIPRHQHLSTHLAKRSLNTPEQLPSPISRRRGRTSSGERDHPERDQRTASLTQSCVLEMVPSEYLQGLCCAETQSAEESR